MCKDEGSAAEALDELGEAIRDRLIVEDPDCPLPESAVAEGTARIDVDLPERVEVDVDAKVPAYLVLADTYDPGWSATVDGRPSTIRLAFAAFRRFIVKEGRQRVVFTYEPAGFRLGLGFWTTLGLVAVLGLPRSGREPLANAPLTPRTSRSSWPLARWAAPGRQFLACGRPWPLPLPDWTRWRPGPSSLGSAHSTASPGPRTSTLIEKPMSKMLGH